jgi:hypothetical protein
MKEIRTYLIILLTIVFVFAVGLETLKASQETTKESAPTTEKVKGPVDSSQVIPKGPQWIGAPIIPDGTTVKQESGRQVIEYNMPYNQVLAWYQEALKKYPDARYRDWKEEMYIEDQGGSKWHAIRISKTDGPKTVVTIQKDNWTWIIATLFIRFTGVFVVLLVLWIGLNISTAILLRTVAKTKEKEPTPASA